MGYIQHHAIVVSASYGYDGPDDQPPIPYEQREHWIEIAHRAIGRLCEGSSVFVTEPTPAAVNSTRSFLVATDGSKEGWTASDDGDAARDRVVAWLREQAYEDGSSALSWAEVQYGDDDLVAKVCRSGDDDYAARYATAEPLPDGTDLTNG